MIKKILRRRAPDSLPYILRINRIYIFPTKTGLIFLLVMLVMFMASLNSNNNLGFLLTFFLASFFIVLILFTYKNLEGLQIRALQTEPVFAGEDLLVNLLLESEGKQQNIYFEGNKKALINYDIKAASINQAQVVFSTEQRGVFEIPDITIYSTFPLGLLRAWTYFRPLADMIVYPKAASDLPSYGYFTESQLVAGAEIKKGGREDFAALRDYVSGDPISNVHWKALAKGQGLFTKLFEGEVGGAFDFDYSFIAGDSEARLSCLAGLIKNAEIKRQAFSLRLPGIYLPVGSGLTHRNNCLEKLARFNQ